MARVTSTHTLEFVHEGRVHRLVPSREPQPVDDGLFDHAHFKGAVKSGWVKVVDGPAPKTQEQSAAGDQKPDGGPDARPPEETPDQKKARAKAEKEAAKAAAKAEKEAAKAADGGDDPSDSADGDDSEKE